MTTLLAILTLIASLFAAWRAWRRLRYFLHMAQLEGYQVPGYLHWFRGRMGQVFVRRSHLIGIALLGLAYLGFRASVTTPTALLLTAAWTVAFASSRLYRSDRQKKPLAYTARLKRLLGTALLMPVLVLGAGARVGLSTGDWSGLLPGLAAFLLADLGAPLWVLAALILTRPIESVIQRGFKKQAVAKLAAHPGLKVVAVTGSYGKTSVKFVVAEVLKQRYQVLATPGSYNTPMGICLVVNNHLRPEHQVLVLEMGMRHPGDIAELCAIATPDAAVVTNVGVAHLETMGSQDAIAAEKTSLLAFTREGGPVVLNVDDPHVRDAVDRARGPVWHVSVEGAPDADITARDITYGPEGASFVVRDEGGREARFQTRLLGRHNVLNILLGIAVGRAFGVRLRQMVPAIARLEPVPHRLQLIREGDIIRIDDAFNSNPVGARNAVEILGQFTTGRRIIVTPGMIELGPRQEEENRALGRHMASHADLAVLVGAEQTRPIREGLREAGFPDDRVRVVASLFQAQTFLQTYLRPGDVVLYENDLPDQYNE